MGDLKNLHGEEAIKKLKEVIAKTNVCMFCTESDGKLPMPTRPMDTQEVDDEGNFWFFSGKSSNKNREIAQDDTVQLLFTYQHSDFLSVTGTVDVFKDHAKVEELWNGLLKTWFKEGKDDPELTLLRVRPTEAYYWGTKNGKIVSTLKVMVSAATGLQMDGAVEGSVNVE